MKKPLIGITTRHDLGTHNETLSGVSETYIKAVQRAGGIPVLLPIDLNGDEVSSSLLSLSGIIFTGGGDVFPQLFNQDLHPKVNSIDVDRDECEMAFARLVIEKKMPFIGICRGMQLINVALGGTLFQHIPDQRINSLRHDCFGDFPLDYLSHEVTVVEKSKAYDIFQSERFFVNSFHHQAVDQPGKQLQVTVRSKDGVIELMEMDEHPFGIAVQWHPEVIPEQETSKKLFAAFIQAADQFSHPE